LPLTLPSPDKIFGLLRLNLKCDQAFSIAFGYTVKVLISDLQTYFHQTLLQWKHYLPPLPLLTDTLFCRYCSYEDDQTLNVETVVTVEVQQEEEAQN